MEKTYKLYTDGSNQRNKGVAGYGGYIEDENGHIVLEFSERILNPNLFNRHELVGLKRGLEIAIENGIKNITCYTDDFTMARLINTNDKEALLESIHHPLQQEVVDLKEYFNKIEVLYIPRKQNSSADKLSRKAIKKYVEENEITGLSDKEYLKNNKFLTSSRFINKDEFIKLNRKIENYIVFSENISNQVDVYIARKNTETNEITANLFTSLKTSKNNQQELFEIITNVLEKHIHLKECALIFMNLGQKSQMTEDILRANMYINKKLKPTIINFENTVNKFDRVFYHKDQKVTDHINEILGKKLPSNNYQLTPENLISAIRQLGEDDYYLGKNPEIELQSKIKEGQDNITELQKYYFGNFMKLSMKDITQLPKKVSSTEKNEIIKNRIQALRDSLTSQGIKLKM